MHCETTIDPIKSLQEVLASLSYTSLMDRCPLLKFQLKVEIMQEAFRPNLELWKSKKTKDKLNFLSASLVFSMLQSFIY